MRELRPADWLKYGGLLTWVLAVTPLVFLPWVSDTPPSTPAMVGYWSAAVLFLLAFWHPVVRSQQLSGLLLRTLIMGLMTGAAFAVSYFSSTGVGILLIMIVSGVLPWVLPIGLGVIWVVLAAMLFALWIMFMPQGTALLGAIQFLITLGLTLFTFLASLLAQRQVQARNELRRVNSELLATQSLLADNTRVAERVRIARELHDLVGHHLTALTLNLEVATHLTEGKARRHVEQAASVARLLLSDVREVVSDMRGTEGVDLRRAMRMLAEGVPEPVIHLDIPDELALADPRRAQVLLRCAQEVITNTVRHASASNLWIRLDRTEDGLALVARDDGRGVGHISPGNGLKGMNERLREIGGRLELLSEPGDGFRIRASMPPLEVAA